MLVNSCPILNLHIFHHRLLRRKVRKQYYPVRSRALKSILDCAGISGTGLGRVEKSVYARILNDCLKVAKGEVLLRILEGKGSAVLGGG